jgi:hypothetical protein
MDDEQPALSAPSGSPAPAHGRAWAAAMGAFLIHNVEEVTLDLPRWTEAHPVLPWLNWMAPTGLFPVTVGVLTAAMGGLALYAMAMAPRWGRLALGAFSIVMLTNAASHIALSVWTSSLMPGAVTAAGVVAPIFAGVLWAVLRRRSTAA